MATQIAKLHIVLDQLKRDKGDDAVKAILKSVGARTLSEIPESEADRALNLAGRADLTPGAMAASAAAHKTNAKTADEAKDDTPPSLADIAAAKAKSPRAAMDAMAPVIYGQARAKANAATEK